MAIHLFKWKTAFQSLEIYLFLAAVPGGHEIHLWDNKIFVGYLYASDQVYMALCPQGGEGD